MSDKHIDYDYYNTLTIKASPAKFEFHGKPNTPNLLFHDGSQTKKYVTTAIYLIKPSNPMFDGELVIEHKLVTNYGERMFTHFPLKTDASITENEIDRLLSIAPGDSLEVNLNKVIVEQSECIYKDTNVAMFTEPILIKTQIREQKLSNIKIIEGATCSGDEINTIEARLNSLSEDMAKIRDHIDNDSIHSLSGGARGVRVGEGEGEISQAAMNNLLKTNTLDCDAIQDESEDKYIAKLLNVPTKTDVEQSNVTNSLATILTLMITSIVLFFTITAGYKEIFKRLTKILNSDIQKSVIWMGIIEGFIPFVFFITFITLSYYKTQMGIAASAAMLSLFYSITIGMTKNKIIDEVTTNQGSQFITRPPWKNTLIYYPLWIFFMVYDIREMYKPRSSNNEE